MKNIVEGIVFETHDSRAQVRLSLHSSCSSCGSCGGGGASVFEADNNIGAKQGQTVLVQMVEKNPLLSAFIMFFLPVLSPILGFAAGRYISGLAGNHSVLFSVIGAAVCFTAAVFFIRIYDKKIKASSDVPVIVSIKN